VRGVGVSVLVTNARPAVQCRRELGSGLTSV
jgi:hypothetical protein